MVYDLHIGIDYSGAKTPISRLKGLQVYVSESGQNPSQIKSLSSKSGKPCNWTRKEIAHWLVEIARGGQQFIAGIDHAFSFPQSYFQRYQLKTWDAFLLDFCETWPTHEPHRSVDQIRDAGPTRTGSSDEFRITERWTSSAKSVFRFDVQGQVAKSTHAGIPWLHHVRQQAGGRIHFWPFDGWEVPEDKCILAEVYPSVFRKRYPRNGRSPDQQDAFATAYWLADMERRGCLDRYLSPPLTEKERRVADYEGWILGAT